MERTDDDTDDDTNDDDPPPLPPPIIDAPIGLGTVSSFTHQVQAMVQGIPIVTLLAKGLRGVEQVWVALAQAQALPW